MNRQRPRRYLRALFAAFLGLAVSLSLASCSCSDMGSADDTVLNRGLGPEPDSVDPAMSRATEGHIVMRDLFEGLMSYGPDGSLIKGVAEELSVSADGLVYTFTLREDARWSNGDPVTASDFVFSYRRVVNPATKSNYMQHFSAVKNANAIVAQNLPPDQLGVVANGERELVITLEAPTPHFPMLLTNPASFPVHRGSINKHGDRFARPGNLITNGPYQLTGWTLGAVLELERNPHYWNDANTSIDTVRYHVTPEPDDELSRYLAGEIDVTSTVPSESFAMLKEKYPDHLKIGQILNVYYYGLNLSHKDLANRDLREALSLAVDRETLARDIIGRGEAPAYSFVPTNVSNYDPPTISAARFDQARREERARQLFADAGYSAANPPDLQLRYNTHGTHKRVALAVQANWRDVLGIEVDAVSEEFRVFLDNVQSKQGTSVFRLAWRAEYDDAYSFLRILQSNNEMNFFNYASESYDRLLASAAVQPNPTKRRSLLEEAEMLGGTTLIPLYFYVSKHLVRPKIKGWQDNVLDYHPSHHLSIEPTN